MCSTCDYKKYDMVTVNGTCKLQTSLGTGKLVLRCDTNGRNWKIGITDNQRDEFTTYSCPTCGRRLV